MYRRPCEDCNLRLSCLSEDMTSYIFFCPVCCNCYVSVITPKGAPFTNVFQYTNGVYVTNYIKLPHDCRIVNARSADGVHEERTLDYLEAKDVLHRRNISGVVKFPQVKGSLSPYVCCCCLHEAAEKLYKEIADDEERRNNART